jgi:succinyl-CoA synthetase alpha subunit
MSIYLNKDSKVIVQGITGGEGTKHTALMLKAGTNVVGGVNARKAGTTVLHGDNEITVFGTVKEAMAETDADVSIVFVPPAFTKDAVVEAIEAGIGLVSKSGTLTYQMMYELRDLGFSTAIGIGGDPVIGTTHIDALAAFEADPETKAIVMIGEIGGDAEERAADYIKAHVTKPVVGYVAGFTAPEGKTMGHAGAIVSGSAGTAQAKKEALEAAGVKVGKTPSETATLLREVYAAL